MQSVVENFRSSWQVQPWWMKGVWLFCLYMTFVYMPWDFFLKPQAQWEQVWLGFTIRGWPAKLTEPIHWAIYASGSWGFLHMRRWMWPWAAVYSVQVMIAMIIFNTIAGPEMGDGRGGGPIMSVIIGGFLAWLTWKLWQARELFQPDMTAESPVLEANSDK